MMIELKRVSVGYGMTSVVDNINLCFESGHFYCLLGANGIGKTTLFKTILGLLPPLSGEVFIDGKRLDSMSLAALSECISYVPQAKMSAYDMGVRDVVVMGRTRFIKKFSQPSEHDYEMCEVILKRLGIQSLADKHYSELSGGEQQIVLIARALTQEAQFILMDEPASNLDFENQKKVLECLQQLSDSGAGIVLSSHSPDHAIYCDMELVLIDKNKCIHTGKIDEMLTDQLLKEVYGVDIHMISGATKDGRAVQSCCLVK